MNTMAIQTPTMIKDHSDIGNTSSTIGQKTTSCSKHVSSSSSLGHKLNQLCTSSNSCRNDQQHKEDEEDQPLGLLIVPKSQRSILSSTSNGTKATTIEKYVTFSKSATMKATIPLSDYTEEELDSVWFTYQELYDNTLLLDKCVEKMELGEVLCDKKYCSRGLEYRTKQGSHACIQNRRKAVYAVLDEQDAQDKEQLERGSTKSLLDWDTSQIRIATAYRRHTSFSEQRAHSLGLKDQQTVETYHREDEEDEQYLSCSSRMASEAEVSTTTRYSSLSRKERQCVDNLTKKWNRLQLKESHLPQLSADMILRFAQCAPSSPFDERSAWRIMKKFDPRYLHLTTKIMKKQLKTNLLFPLPSQLKTKEGNEVFYMRPSLFRPTSNKSTMMSLQDVIDNLVYVMSSMNEKESNSKNGIAFIANMDGWTMKNFSLDYCFKFMMMLQGRVPTRVTHFLIVNPPTWFDKVYAVMKKMLLPSFQKRVHMISEHQLDEFLVEGYEEYLPSELSTGRANTKEIVHDFIEQRRRLEKKRGIRVSSSIIPTSTTTTKNDEEPIVTKESISRMDLTVVSDHLGVSIRRVGIGARATAA